MLKFLTSDPDVEKYYFEGGDLVTIKGGEALMQGHSRSCRTRRSSRRSRRSPRGPLPVGRIRPAGRSSQRSRRRSRAP
ncbi:MAG: hypothetical protein R3C32_00510 [Chloroflexota bacterium]